jgi:hypothetical protein
MGVILTRRGTVRCVFSHPLLHCTCIGLRLGCKVVQNHVSPFNYVGRRRGRGSDVVSGSSQTATPFQFLFIVLHGRGAFANFIPCRLILLQPSSPTSSLVANFNPRRRQLQPLSPFNFQTPSLFYFSPSP